MKALKSKIADSKYSEDYKKVLKNYLLKNAVIEKYNQDESNILKNKKHEKILI